MPDPTFERGKTASPIQTRTAFKPGDLVLLWLHGDPQRSARVILEFTDVYGVCGVNADKLGQVPPDAPMVLFPWYSIKSMTLEA